jgi:endonuclease-3 related protein
MSILRQIFETLREYYAAKPEYLWWSENPIEVILGAVLVQGSTWKSVENVLNEFRSKELLDFNKIVQQTEEQIAEWIRPVGFQTKKAQRIKAVAQMILERCEGDLDRYFARDVDTIRRELLSISGIGHGTADNILLYAGQVPIYMVDTFTVRVLIRHGIANPYSNEPQIQELIHRELTPDESPYGAKLFQKMQEYIVRLGRDFCDKSKPNCSQCPLNDYLPESGAVGITTPAPPRAGTYGRRFAQQKNISPLQEESKRNSPPVEGQGWSPKGGELLGDLNETERKIVEAIGAEPMPIDSVVLSVQLPVHIVRATIAVLQMKRLVCQVEGNQVRRM